MHRLRQPVEHAALDEGDRPCQQLQPHRTHQQHHAAAKGVGEVDAGTAHRIGRSAVRHQRIGGEGEEFVENHEGEEIAGQRQAHRGGDAQAEEAEEPAAVWRVFEVADGVNRRDEPQDRRQGHE